MESKCRESKLTWTEMVLSDRLNKRPSFDGRRRCQAIRLRMCASLELFLTENVGFARKERTGIV